MDKYSQYEKSIPTYRNTSQGTPDYLNAKYRREYKDLGNLARLARTYQTSIRDYGELMRLVQSARAGGLSPFHQIVSKCPKLSQLKSLITHSATSILNVDSGSFIILHIFKRTQDCGLLELNNVFFPRRTIYFRHRYG